MTLKTGSIVNHSGALEWGAGKVLEVTATMATIHFSDGKNRKIAVSHFPSLQAATLASYIPPSESAPTEKTVPAARARTRAAKIKK